MHYYRNPETKALVAYDDERDLIYELEAVGRYAGTVAVSVAPPPAADPELPARTPNKDRYDGEDEKRVEEVLALLAKKMKKSEIAKQLGIKIQTVKNIKTKYLPQPAGKKTLSFEGHECCGAKGARHMKSCPNAGKGLKNMTGNSGPKLGSSKAPLPRAPEDPAEEEKKSPAELREPLTGEQFIEVKRLLHEENLGSQEVAKQTGFPIEEVNAMAISHKYGMYIFNRKRKS